mmetsp:Transcript_33645/g.101656  ORF Transcript_33645/g.101656 Transcript_33645/m.101656 type:complete len:215 (+) Transcript_33645:938-1582(+)
MLRSTRSSRWRRLRCPAKASRLGGTRPASASSPAPSSAVCRRSAGCSGPGSLPSGLESANWWSRASRTRHCHRFARRTQSSKSGWPFSRPLKASCRPESSAYLPRRRPRPRRAVEATAPSGRPGSSRGRPLTNTPARTHTPQPSHLSICTRWKFRPVHPLLDSVQTPHPQAHHTPHAGATQARHRTLPFPFSGPPARLVPPKKTVKCEKGKKKP